MIAIRKGQGFGMIAVCVIAGNIVGFVIGTYGAELLSDIVPISILIHAITSFITTEFIGFCMLLLFNSIGGGRRDYTWMPGMRPVIIMIAVLLLIRVVYSKFLGDFLSEEGINLAIRLLLGNSLAIIVLICLNVIYYIISQRSKWLSTPIGYTIGIAVAASIIAALSTFIIGYHLPFGTQTPFSEATFAELFAITFLVSLIIYVLLVLITYVYSTRTRIEKEQEKRRFAQFQYNILKQQVNPHFLFNSLNILNGLIEEKKNNEACEYVLKLASLYRYMLKNEHEHLVSLNDELAFIDQYIDLLKVRFPNSFIVEKQIAPSATSRFVVQCSLQVLIENAFKHNIVRQEQPLHIIIKTEEDCIIVSNNLQLKSSSTDSTKVGLKNISKQYINAVGQDIEIIKSDDKFEVKLPLI